jgi:hypothetical protein
MTHQESIDDVKAKLGEVARMLDEMRAHLSVLGEDQVLWVPPGEDVWPIQRAVTHCVNCEHRAVTELERALEGEPTPETVRADTAIFAWFGPTPYALGRLVAELKARVDKLGETLGAGDLKVEAVRYPKHPSRKLAEYVEVMRRHTTGHLAGIRKKMEVMPPTRECDDEVRSAYPQFGRGAS